MLCPKCKCGTTVCDTRYDVKENEVFRRHKCKECEYEFFTVEFEIEDNEKFMTLWKSLTRGAGKNHDWRKRK